MYDYSVAKLADRTSTVPLQELVDPFQGGKSGRNFLDIENCTNIHFKPTAVSTTDLYTLRASAARGDVGKTNSD